VRYAERLHFDFDLETLAAFMEAVKAGALATLSPRRILNEVLIALDEPAPARVVEEFFERGLFFQLPIVSEDNVEFVCSALSRLEVNRAAISADEFKQAGRLILLAGLLQDGREDIALAAHEGGKVIAAARRVQRQECKAKSQAGVAEVFAQYCVHPTVEARVLLEESLQGGEE
jgi:tRNA nucleotidyltransferase/poly(A) polymerase